MSITKENNDQKLRELIRTHGVTKPDMGFADSIMDKIELSENKSTTVVSEPLISIGGWVIIGLIIIIMFSLVFLLGTPSELFKNISEYTNMFKLQTIDYNIPNTYLIGLFGFMTFFLVEISLIKRKFNRI